MSKKGRNIEEPRISRAVNNTRGSHLWSYNHYRTCILTNLLNDLIDLENIGLEKDVCKMIQKTLDYFINASTNVPKGGFLSGRPLYKEIETFAKTYETWNNVKGRDPDSSKKRRIILRNLREKKQKISNKVRRLQYELENNLDQKILTDSYKAIGDMIKLVPNIFNNLASSYGDYIKRV